MNNTRTLVYDFNEHGLYYENNFIENKKIYTFTIDTLEMEFDFITGDLVSIKGYLPLVKAERGLICVPHNVAGVFKIPVRDFEWMQGVAYEYCDYYSESRKYLFINDFPRIEYDEKNKKILIGIQNRKDKCLKIDKNILCGFDADNNLKYLILSLDKIIIYNYISAKSRPSYEV